MKDATILSAIGIVCFTILEIVALREGIDGFYFTTVLALIAAGAGIGITDVIRQKKS